MRRTLLKIMAVSLMFAGSFAFADALDAVVVSSTGKVEVQNGAQWVPVKEGDVLKKGSVVQTGFKSELVLKVKESNMKISQLTRMVIENLSAGSDKDDTRIFIDTGSVRSEVNRSGARKVGFTVRSPVATASVRGTIVKLSNEYRGAKVETERGVVLAWPTTVSEPVVEEDQPSEETNGTAETNETAETDGSIANGALSSQSIENAPANSVTITKAQTTGFSSSGNVTSAQVNAYSNTTVESSSTKSVAFSESVASSGNSGAMTMSSSSNSAAATGSLSITAKFED